MIQKNPQIPGILNLLNKDGYELFFKVYEDLVKKVDLFLDPYRLLFFQEAIDTILEFTRKNLNIGFLQ